MDAKLSKPAPFISDLQLNDDDDDNDDGDVDSLDLANIERPLGGGCLCK